MPTLTDFDPKEINWQFNAICEIRLFDYETHGLLEALFSGAIGSAKSELAAHLMITHCILNKDARVIVVRRALKDLKRTIWKTIKRHLPSKKKLAWSENKSEMTIRIPNVHGGYSEIIGDSYDDMNLEKFRSLEISMAVIEEASESNKELVDALKMRLGRCLGVKENILLLLTNPDSRRHFIFKEFIQNQTESRKVFYSLTADNKFLPKWYLGRLKDDLTPKQALRMLYGQWIDLDEERIYYNYESERNFLKDKSYDYQKEYPIDLMFDFNIGEGKPMSSAWGQYDNKKVYHIAKEFIVDGYRTRDICHSMVDELIKVVGKDYAGRFRIFGDSAGKNKDTRNNSSDYDIIIEVFRKAFTKAKIEFRVPLANPSVRNRHNIANTSFLNENGKVRFYLYKGCEVSDEGFNIVGFKKNSDKEDDSVRSQHVTTAITYYMHFNNMLNSASKSREI